MNHKSKYLVKENKFVFTIWIRLATIKTTNHFETNIIKLGNTNGDELKLSYKIDSIIRPKLGLLYFKNQNNDEFSFQPLYSTNVNLDGYSYDFMYRNYGLSS